MGFPDDPRLRAAKARTMREVFDKLAISGLSRGAHNAVGPCPACGGRDRFEVNFRKGLFWCRRCSPRGGDHIALVSLVMACDFRGALDYLEGSADVLPDPAEIARREAEKTRRRAEDERRAAFNRRAAILEARDMWGQAVPFLGTPAEDYLRLRGLDFRAAGENPPCLRFLPDHPYKKTIARRRHVLHRGPAMIAAVQDAAGRLRAVHQTWIDLDAPKGKARIMHPETGKALASKLVRGSKKGGAIRITGTVCTDTLIIGEGIETSATAWLARAVPGASVWAGVDLGNMGGRQSSPGVPDLSDETAFLPPPHVRRLVFVRDGDSDPRATRNALRSGLLRAKAARPDLAGYIVDPGDGLDLNDLAQG